MKRRSIPPCGAGQPRRLGLPAGVTGRRPGPRFRQSMVLVSGGQTGADRGALEAARACAVPITGWCPGGRWTEAGPLERCWPLTPTPMRRPVQRTLRNLRLADGVLILAGRRPRGGSIVLPRSAGAARPRIVLDPRADRAVSAALRFCRRHRIRRLLVGGPRESEEPGIREAVRAMMTRLYETIRRAGSLPLDRAGRF